MPDPLPADPASADLAPQERAVLALIAANPFVSQQDIADTLGLARSTVASHIVRLVHKGRILGRGYVLPAASRVICVGGAVLDRKYRTLSDPIMQTSNPAAGHSGFGGVARNVAENLLRMGVAVSFVSIVGDDETGRALLRQLRDLGADVSQVITAPEGRTAEYAAILTPQNELAIGIADMAIFEQMQPAHLDRVWPHLAAAAWVFCDCNMPAPVLEALIRRRPGARYRLAVDTVSAPKARRLPPDLTGVDVLFTNLDEATAILAPADAPSAVTLSANEAALALRARGAGAAVVTRGADGYVLATERGARAMPAVPARPVDITGAGDAMIAGTLARMVQGDDLATASRTGALLASLTTESPFSVHPDLSPHLLAAGRHRIPA
jgi:pseudouridine kinase